MIGRRLLALFALAALRLYASPLDVPVDYGRHFVGFRTVFQYDYSRTYRRFDTLGAPVANTARPIETLIWYPATAATGKAMVYSDYLDLIANEESFAPATAEQKRIAAESLRFGMNEADWNAIRAMPIHAARDATAERGRFPLIIYAPGLNGVAFSNSILCEMLASHGYVVVASPSIGQHSRALASTVAGAETEARDIQFLIASMHDDPQADFSHIGAVGQSWGGIANIFAAAQSSAIGALVCLDGSIRYYYDTFLSWHEGTIGAMTAPVLFMARRPYTPEELAQSANLLKHNFFDDLKTVDFWYVTMSRMRHIDFLSNVLRLGPPDPKFSPSEMAEAYAWNARYVREFLDAMLKGDSAARKFLDSDPAENGVPANLVAVTAHKASQPPIGVDEFAHFAASSGGIVHASEAYAEMKKANAQYTLDESEVNGWGYSLLRRKHVDEAIAVLRLNTEIYPKSANTYDSLGEACAVAGRKDEAIANYRKSLELNPANTNATDWLKRLGAQ
jgi:dienelactone hydrolase